jgi:hypothetical protein
MSNNTGGNAKVLEGDLKKSSSEVWWERKNTSSSESTHSKQASSYILICCCCSLLVLIKVLKYVHANSMSPSPSGNLKTIYGPLLWLRLRFLSFSKHASLPNLKKYGQMSHPDHGNSATCQDTFSIMYVNLHTWLNTRSWKMDWDTVTFMSSRDTEMGFCCNVFVNSKVSYTH